MTPDGLIVRPSRFDAGETVERLASAVASHGMTVVARIDHEAAAADVGLALAPATVLIFGNPRAGTPLMQTAPTLAIDLPLRELVWQDAAGQAWIGYNDPKWLARRHRVDPSTPPVQAMSDTLASVVYDAADAE